jgi:hypothetical protein
MEPAIRFRTDDLLITNPLLRSVGQTPLHCPNSVLPADAFANIRLALNPTRFIRILDFGHAIRGERLDSHFLGFIHVIGQEVQAD